MKFKLLNQCSRLSRLFFLFYASTLTYFEGFGFLDSFPFFYFNSKLLSSLGQYLLKYFFLVSLTINKSRTYH